ncbi:hypothetical protein [Nonlabens ulvanivorans]|uniref:hypothetical protein n=1 Tax=Nonlabens ulvanivorans TaxID=906888 RepID=UPI002941EF34|nr:hypothetical protein [Nonlabens ulvanivorans]WOI21620.1 hypothetical protein R1T42_07985 [Nonlabens ulvanivorans]
MATRKFYFLFILCQLLLITSCVNEKEIEFDFVAKSSFSGNLAKELNGVTYRSKFTRLITKYEQIESLCDVIDDTNCLNMDSNKLEDLKRTLETKDLIVSKFEIEGLFSNTEYTKLDQCPEWLTPIELRHKERIDKNMVFIYSIKSKNKYRLGLCP